jgi:hypothetical protein
MGLRRNEEQMERMNEDEKGEELEQVDGQSAKEHRNGGEGYAHAPLSGGEDSTIIKNNIVVDT